MPYIHKQGHPEARVLATMHGPMPFTSKPVEKPCFVAASEAHARFLKWNLNMDCLVIPHGINLDTYGICQQKDDYLLFLARVAEEKGAIDFVRLCRAVGMKGVLAGPDHATADPIFYPRAVMEACSDSHGLVQYYGEVGNNEEKVDLLQHARCLVCPIRPPYIEIWGMGVTEALATGTPVLHTRNGGAIEQIIHGVTGAIADDVTCLESNLKLALECDPLACRKRAEEFSRERMAANYATLYQRMVEENYSW